MAGPARFELAITNLTGWGLNQLIDGPVNIRDLWGDRWGSNPRQLGPQPSALAY